MKDRRNVTKKGIKYKGKMFWADFLQDSLQKSVTVQLDHKGRLEVYLENVFMGHAYPKDTTNAVERIKSIVTGSKTAETDISGIPTYKLVEELSKRDGIKRIEVGSQNQYQIKKKGMRIKEFGPVVILEIKD